MNKYHLICVAVALLGASASTSVFAGKDKAPEIDKDWIGTWKLDPAQTKYGFTVTYSESKSKRKMIHAVSGMFDYDYAFDGKDYKNKLNPAMTRSIAPAGENAWEGVQKVNGKTVFNYRLELSADGKTLEFKVKGTSPDEAAFSEIQTYERVSGKKGLVGKWHLIKRTPPPEETMINSSTAPGVFRWESPEDKTFWEGKADGKDVALKGPNAPPGYTYALRQIGPRKQSETSKVNGKVVQLGTVTLAKDGKSYVDEAWFPGHEDEKDIRVYIKQ